MSQRITRLFAACRKEQRAALIPFLMAGDRSLRDTERLLRMLDAEDVDLIELGVPFSDPLADGPTMQAAAQRALASGTTIRRVFALVRRFRRISQRPVVLLSYLNPLLAMGGARPATTSVGIACRPCLRAARRAGVDGLVIPDLPVEESASLRAVARREGVAIIPLAAPTSTTHRLRQIARAGRGFIYYVSVTGTTGARRRLPADVTQGIRRLQRMTRVPVCVGFGISTPAQARQMATVANGVIVGSALVRRWAVSRSVAAVGRLVRSLRQAVHGRR